MHVRENALVLGRLLIAVIRPMREKTVLASNNSNFVKPAPGEPVLVSWDDATTFFHEFGHALHFLQM
ncbi:MAG: M3 family metallopeptidase [Bacteroidia bacterium]